MLEAFFNMETYCSMKYLKFDIGFEINVQKTYFNIESNVIDHTLLICFQLLLTNKQETNDHIKIEIPFCTLIFFPNSHE